MSASVPRYSSMQAKLTRCTAGRIPFSRPARCIRVASRWQPQTARSEQDTSSWHDDDRPPPPPRPPPGYQTRSDRIQESGLSKGLMFGIVAGAGLLAGVWGWQVSSQPAATDKQKDAPAMVAQSKGSTSPVAEVQKMRDIPTMQGLPTTLDGVPIGLNKQWRHRWYHDGNGQLYVKLEDSWYAVQRPPATKRVLILTLTRESARRLGDLPRFEWKVPDAYPVDEIDLTNPKQLKDFFGTNKNLANELRQLNPSESKLKKPAEARLKAPVTECLFDELLDVRDDQHAHVRPEVQGLLDQRL